MDITPATYNVLAQTNSGQGFPGLQTGLVQHYAFNGVVGVGDGTPMGSARTVVSTPAFREPVNTGLQNAQRNSGQGLPGWQTGLIHRFSFRGMTVVVTVIVD